MKEISFTNIKSFVNYAKSKESPRLDYQKPFDVNYLGEEELRRAEKIIKRRHDNSPVMRVNKSELEKIK